MSVLYRLKEVVRRGLTPLIYRYPPSGLGPDRLYFFLHNLKLTKDVPGAVVEVGCSLGGSTVIANGFLRAIGAQKDYYCIDTFDGFVPSQFAADTRLGTPERNRHAFSGNSKALVEGILAQHNVAGVKLIQGDIATLADEMLPEHCSLVLADVDLTEPTRSILERFYPRLAPGGVILVDDCGAGSDWKARLAYQNFCRERQIPEHFEHGMGVLRAPGENSRAG